ncbi:MAG: hypothetical protein Alpg2KO_30060 [Alphaproteobacteria bacterium]
MLQGAGLALAAGVAPEVSDWPPLAALAAVMLSETDDIREFVLLPVPSIADNATTETSPTSKP